VAYGDERVGRPQVDSNVVTQQAEQAITNGATVILLVAGYKGSQYWQQKRAESAARDYFAALALAGQGKSEEAAKKFAVLGKGGHAGYALLARCNLFASKQ
jgi:hypothetical protein